MTSVRRALSSVARHTHTRSIADRQACPGEMQHDPLKKLLTTRDMDESNANDGSWDVLESPQDGSAEMERRRLSIDGDIKLCLLDKKH